MHDRLFALKVKVGELVTVSRTQEDGSAWTSNGAIRSITGSSTSIVLERGLQAFQDKFRIQSALGFINIDRMQSGLKAFAVDELACSTAVFNSILGLHHSVGPSFVSDNLVNGDGADGGSLNADQRLALHRARLPASLIQCPPGTGKTTVARLYGQILRSLGLLSKGDVVLATPADLLGSPLGPPPPPPQS